MYLLCNNVEYCNRKRALRHSDPCQKVPADDALNSSGAERKCAKLPSQNIDVKVETDSQKCCKWSSARMRGPTSIHYRLLACYSQQTNKPTNQPSNCRGVYTYTEQCSMVNGRRRTLFLPAQQTCLSCQATAAISLVHHR